MVEPSAAATPPDDERALLQRCRDGDREAFRAVIEQYAPTLGRLIGALVDDADTVADLVQETFVRAWCGLDGYRGGEPAAWLGRIAVNVARGHCRSAWWRKVDLDPAEPVLLADADDEPEASCLRAELADRLRAALARLPRHQAEAIRLRFLAGESYVHMGELAAKPESTMRARVKAGLERLRAELGDVEGREARP